LVDVVDEGQRKGVEVTEVRDVYDAYKAFTGKDLPRPVDSTDVRVRIKTTQTNAETGPIAPGSVLYGVDQTYTVVLDGVAKTLTLYRNGGLPGPAELTDT